MLVEDKGKGDGAGGAASDTYNPQELEDLLPSYYSMLFPTKLFYRWLSYGDKSYFERREFSFTLPGDIYLRYQSFENDDKLTNSLKQKRPEKIDIGAVFNMKPAEYKNMQYGSQGFILSSFTAQHRELVFDIDMTDYDECRTCCSEANICPKCWPFMTIAAKVLDRALREDFGFKNIMYVYSGRRGIHCWVADERARKLSQDARSALAEYLNLLEGGGEFKVKRVSLPGTNQLHPHIEKSLEIIKPYFVSLMIENQSLMSTEESCQFVANLCTDSKLRQAIRELFTGSTFSKFKTATERWVSLCGTVVSHSRQRLRDRKRPIHIIEEVMLQYCYPRLDINVSKGINHLLKSPFSVHPKTGRVCVPIDIHNIDSFDPFKVPLVSRLIKECESATLNGNKSFDTLYEQTSLKSAIKLFEQFVQGCEREVQKTKSKDAIMEF